MLNKIMGIDKYPPFLSEEDRKKKITEWKKASANEQSEKKGYMYPAVRMDREGRPGSAEFDSFFALDVLHGQSFVHYIKKLIDERGGKEVMKQRNEKIKVIDIGGGAGLFAHQLRQEFGDLVRVYTTGLRRKSAKKAIGHLQENNGVYGGRMGGYVVPADKIPGRIHSDDLKWRSIRELRDFPEFDLIVDTFGESFHGKRIEAEEYLEAVVSKLAPGGMASIVPFTDGITSLKKPFPEIKKDVEAKFSGIHLFLSGEGSEKRLKIIKENIKK